MPLDFSGQNLRGRSFKGQDLTGANFSGADIRGTNFTNAILRGVDFTRAIAGLQKRWMFSFYCISLLLSIILGFTSAINGYFIIYFFLPSSDQNIILGILILLAHAVFLKITFAQGVETALGILITIIAITGGLAVTGTGAIAVAVAITIGIAVAFVNATIIVFAFVGIFANRLAIVGFGSLALASAVFFTLDGTAANAFTLAFALALPNVISITGASSAAIALTIIAAVIILSLSCQTAWRTVGGSNNQVHRIATTLAATGGTSFLKADLTDANFNQATLKNTDLREAHLIRTSWFQSHMLNFARIGNSYLQYAKVQRLVTTGEGQDAKLDRLSLEGINLRGANLQDTSFIGVILNNANLQESNLSRAKLKQAQLDGADLTGATLTGAYIEDWGITGETKLNGVRCKYIYMRLPTKENPDPLRKPDNRNEIFKDGDFADFIRPLVDTLDLYHNQGVDPRAIAISFKQLAEEHPDAQLEIVAMEKRGVDKLLLRANTASQADKSQLSAEYFSTYNRVKAMSAAEVKALLAEKDNRIQSLEAMVATALQRPNFYAETYYSQRDINMSGDRSINMGDGDYREINNEGTYVEGNYYNSPQERQNLVEAAAEIQQLLEQLEKTYGTVTNVGKMQIATEAVKRIEEENPTLMRRVFSAFRTGTISAIEQSLNHPAASFFIAAAQDWQQTQPNDET